MDKPFELRYVEARDFLTQAVINVNKNYGIPYIFINTFIQDLARQVTVESQKELDIVNKKYLESCKNEKDIKQDTSDVEDKERF